MTKQTKASKKPGSRNLTRVKVIAATLDLIDKVGADGLTMRGVAQAVGVTPMALYNHFSSKEDLLRAIAADVVDGAVFDGGEASWSSQLAFCFRAFRAICLRHPGLPRLLETADVAPSAVFAPMEVTLRALGHAGLPEIDGLRTYFTLVSFTLAQASYQSRGPYPDLEPSERIRSERLAGRGYETTAKVRLPDEWDFDAAFEFGLALILDGVEQALLRARQSV